MSKGKLSLVFWIVLVVLSGCDAFLENETEVYVETPDLSLVSLEVAQTILTQKSLIPVIVEMYDDSTIEGNVITTHPKAGELIKPFSRVNVYISLGPREIVARDATMEWYHVTGSDSDTHTFYTPKIIEGELHIEMTVEFNSNQRMFWRDERETGFSFGTASIVDTFDKIVPIRIEYETIEILPRVPQNIVLIIPIRELNSARPTTIFTRWVVELGDNRNYDVEVNFTISW